MAHLRKNEVEVSGLIHKQLRAEIASTQVTRNSHIPRILKIDHEKCSFYMQKIKNVVSLKQLLETISLTDDFKNQIVS